jgi:hypothetical protein
VGPENSPSVDAGTVGEAAGAELGAEGIEWDGR